MLFGIRPGQAEKSSVRHQQSEKDQDSGAERFADSSRGKGGLLATRFLKRYRLQSKFQELLEQAGMKWSTHGW